MEEVVKAGGACIGSPETCVKVLDYLTDAGVDEALMMMQMLNGRNANPALSGL
jgi:hypothetical protein